MLGSVHVSVVLLESNSVRSNDNPTAGTALEENWSAASIAAVKQKVTDGLQWWVDTLADITDKHQLRFQIDFTYADNPVTTRFEPITQPSTDYQYWVREFLDSAGVASSGDIFTDIEGFNHQQREANSQNWGFTIFVVNDENDVDHKFAAGGLDRAFAFPGGLFLVTLASRPASTITHETGHIFWALDEYQGGGVYNNSRGYYDTQNVNAWNNPVPGYVRVPSIMDRGSCDEGGGLLCDAFQQHTSSPSSLEMLGWRDSDGDGIFDVLDVQHSLEGTGHYDAEAGLYRFVGESSVQTLPNLNPRQSSLPTESLQSDITINRISRVEYRIDGGAWQTAASPDTYVAALDVSFAVPPTAGMVEIRTIDDVSGVTSPAFSADLSRPASTWDTGVRGFVFDDIDGDAEFDSGEAGLAGRTVRVVDEAGQPIRLDTRIEPDDYASSAVIGNAVPGATLIAIGSATSGPAVYARSAGQGSTGTQVFGACSFAGSGGACSIYQTEWTSKNRQLRISFDEPVSTVSIDAVSNGASDYGRLAIYDADDNLLARYTTDSLAAGQVETMTLSRAQADIAYAIAGGHADTGIQLDNLRFGPEASAVTDELGGYGIAYLPAGTYRIQVEPLAGSQPTTPTTQSVTLSAASSAPIVDFGFVASASSWQNPANRFDVNNDGTVSPIDALLIINDVNLKGARTLTASDVSSPFVDVNGDGHATPIDVLQVINRIDGAQSEGESVATMRPADAPRDTVSVAPEGEFVPVVTPQHEISSVVGSQAAVSIAAGESEGQSPQFPAANSRTGMEAAPRDRRVVELAVIDDLGGGSELDNLIDQLAGDVAAAGRLL